MSGTPLFQIHAEKVLAAEPPVRQAGAVPGDDQPRDRRARRERSSREHRYFGLPPDEVTFFQQGTMPAVDLATGRLLLEAPGRLFLSPNGHGGTLTALADSGLLADLAARGVKHVFYFQVDNPLVKVCDPGFIGRHIAAESEASSKVVREDGPDGEGRRARCRSTAGARSSSTRYLPKQLAAAARAGGRTAASAPAARRFTFSASRSWNASRARRPDRCRTTPRARRSPHFDPRRQAVSRPKENALKFERFIFDALPHAERWLAVETPRAEEFAPIKNAERRRFARDGPRSADRACTPTGWTRAGMTRSGHPVEVSPLFALDADELPTKIRHHGPTKRLTGPTVSSKDPVNPERQRRRGMLLRMEIVCSTR